MKRIIYAVLILCASQIYAATMCYESFAYPAGSITGQNGGFGWNGAWTFEYIMGTQEVVAEGLSFGALPVGGGALKLTEDATAGSFRSVGVRRLVGFSPTAGADLWVSFLAKSAEPLSTFTSKIAEIRHGATAGATKLRMQPKGSSSQGVMIAYDNASSNSAAKSAQDGNTYLYVCRFGDVATDEGKYAVMWVFNLDGYNAAMADGIFDEADLNTYYYLQAQDTHANQTININEGVLINIGDSDGVYQFSYIFDELRYGNSIQDVVPNTLLASNPYPVWGQEGLKQNVNLAWTPAAGVLPNGNQIYFGTSRAAVEAADISDTTGIYLGSQDANSLAVNDLELATRYFWRVDQNTSSGIKKGYVWDFWTLVSEVVDNFDTYTDTAAMKNLWQDYTVNNSGATISLETSIKQSGKAMKYLYERSYGDSVATKVYAQPQDWSAGGQLLVMDIPFRGTAANTTDQTMSVRIKDSFGASAVVSYDNSADLALEVWTAWHIEMNEFAGVDLSSVKEFSILFTGGSSSGSGYVYFDNIAIYPCRAGALSGDLNEDCVVNIGDFSIIASQWLQVQLY